jgi:putative YhbY family RNA-binding protein
MEPLLPSFRRALRARAHHLHPVVSIGHHGLTPAVLHEADVALTAHELIKVRVASDQRAEREEILARLCAALDCAPVQQIGKLLVLWRPRPKDMPEEDGRPKRARRPNTAAPTSAPVAAKNVRKRSVARNAPSGVPRAALPRRRRGIGRAS